MKTKNAMQLKALINNKAKEACVSPQLMLQNYMLERLIDRISRSEWKDCIIVKGGMLIGSLIGVDRRTTKDLDTTVRGFELSHGKIKEVFDQVCSVSIDDDLHIELVRTEDIRESDDYPGIRVFLKALYGPMAIPLSIDVTTGDKITPEAIVYEYPFVFDEGSAAILAYPIETVLAEKIETVLSRNVATTRIRDFYDIYELWHVKGSSIDLPILAQALKATCEKRNSHEAVERKSVIIAEMREDEGLKRQWEAYCKKHSYTRGISFVATVDTVAEILGASEFR